MRRIPGMATNEHTAYRRRLIIAAVEGFCASGETHATTIAREAIAVADAVIDLLAEPVDTATTGSFPVANPPDKKGR